MTVTNRREDTPPRWDLSMHPDHDYLYATRRAEINRWHRDTQRRRDHSPPASQRDAGRFRRSLARALRQTADLLTLTPGRTTSRD